MNWITDVLKPKIRTLVSKIRNVPEDLWIPCKKCGNFLYKKDVLHHLNVCDKCGYHMSLTSDQRFKTIFDDDTYKKIEMPETFDDPLNFKDLKAYKSRLKEYREKTKEQDVVQVGVGKIDGTEAVLAVFNFDFMGGSMGTAVGEAVIKASEVAIKKHLPLIIIPSSGGARMQEGMLSLMQMARTTLAINKVKEAGLPYIVVLSNPTTGGVSASFAMLGDIHIAEQGAIIGFAGKRVIEQTIKQKLPPNFQTAEYLQEAGMVDIVINRHKLKETLGTILKILMSKGDK